MIESVSSYTTFAFNLKHRGDIAMIQDCLHLDGEQAGYLGRLEVGWAIVKLQGRWFLPFLVKLPLIHVEKGSVTDEDIRRRTGSVAPGRLPLSHHKAVSGGIPARGGDSEPQSTRDAPIPPIPSGGKREGEDEKKEGQCTIELTTQDMGFLKDVWQYPTSAVTERYRRLFLSRRSGNSIQDSLLRHSFLSSSFVISPEGRIKMLELTRKGRNVLGMSSGESDRHGGAEHRYWCKVLADRLRAQGYAVTEEAPIGGGKTIDLLAERGGKRIAFEVETGKSDAAANVRKCLEAGMDNVVVVPISHRAKEALSKKILADPRVRCVIAAKAVRMLEFAGRSGKTPRRPVA